MRTRVREPEPSLRGEIEYLLEHREPDFDRGEDVATAWTAEALAEELGAKTQNVRRVLTELVEAGIATFRQHRPTGAMLFKLKDIHHDRWQEFTGGTRH